MVRHRLVHFSWKQPYISVNPASLVSAGGYVRILFSAITAIMLTYIIEHIISVFEGFIIESLKLFSAGSSVHMNQT